MNIGTSVPLPAYTAWWREFADEDPPTDLDVDPETVL